MPQVPAVSGKTVVAAIFSDTGALAGVLEGFVSPNYRIPLNSKLLISAVTAVLLGAYLMSGWRRTIALPAPSAPGSD